MAQSSGLHPRPEPAEVIGYTPDEKLRRQQLRELRRRWLKDQELSPREPVLPPQKLGLVEGFWVRFLQPNKLWRKQVFNLFKAGRYTLLELLLPIWATYYVVKYHILPSPYGVVQGRPPVYPGDKIIETEEVVPPLEIPKSEH